MADAPQGNALSSQLGEQADRAVVAAEWRRADSSSSSGVFAMACTRRRSVCAGHGVVTAHAPVLRSGSEKAMNRISTSASRPPSGSSTNV